MPIPGISEVRRLPRLGVIRLGEKRTNGSGKEFPAKLDYFNLKDAPGVAEIFGAKPKEIEILLPHENTEFFFPQSRKAYGTSGLFCCSKAGEVASRVRVGISDGEGTRVPKGQPLDPEGEKYLADKKLTVKTGDRFELPCAGQECSYTIKKLCRPIGQFLFMIPRVPSFGCFQITTTSFNSMVELNSYIDAIRAAAGRISMIPLVLSLVPKKVTIPGTRQSTGIFHLKLEYRRPLAELIRYRDVKYISAELLPQIAHETPDDLYPEGGEVLEGQVGKMPAETDEPEPQPELAEESAPQPEAEVPARVEPAPSPSAKPTPAKTQAPKKPLFK